MAAILDTPLLQFCLFWSISKKNSEFPDNCFYPSVTDALARKNHGPGFGRELDGFKREPNDKDLKVFGAGIPSSA